MAISNKFSQAPLIHEVPRVESFGLDASSRQTGALVINADDWGYDRATTDRILECAVRSVISSTSGMVFMEDSARAADLAQERGIDVGLHMNLTEAFSGPNVSSGLKEHHGRVAKFLLFHRFCQIVYHPGLANSFAYVAAAQVEEFQRIYDRSPQRIDGHHHMHLSENVLSAKLLPAGTLVRRNFSFAAGEKGKINRSYRKFIDGRLQRRHRLVDFLFNIAPVQTERLERIFSYARHATVELETHPVNAMEFEFLTSSEMARLRGGVPIASSFAAAFTGDRLPSAAPAFLAQERPS